MVCYRSASKIVQAKRFHLERAVKSIFSLISFNLGRRTSVEIEPN